MKFIDLFAGIGGFRTGLANAGHTPVGYVEWDKFARKSYEAMYDTDGEWTALDIDDVKASEMPEADIWTFGSPCTNISNAGNRKGLAGDASKLFFTVMQLLADKPESERPKYIWLENVKALLSSNGGWDFARVLAEMDAVGYDVQWRIINSGAYVPQNRERIFVVGSLRAKIKDSRESFSFARVPEQTPANKIKQVGNIAGSWFGGNPQIGRIYSPEGLAPTLSTMGGGGQIPKIILKNDGDSEYLRELTPRECWRLQGFTDEQFDKAQEVNSNSQLYKQAGNSVSVPVIESIARELK